MARALTLPERSPFDRRGVLRVIRVLGFSGPVRVTFERLKEAGYHRRGADGAHEIAVAAELAKVTVPWA